MNAKQARKFERQLVREVVARAEVLSCLRTAPSGRSSSTNAVSDAIASVLTDAQKANKGLRYRVGIAAYILHYPDPAAA